MTKTQTERVEQLYSLSNKLKNERYQDEPAHITNRQFKLLVDTVIGLTESVDLIDEE